MFDQSKSSEPPDDDDRPPPGKAPIGEADRGPSALVLLLVAAVLVIGGYFLAVKLKDMVRLQNCILSGRTNCAPIVAPDSH